MNIYNLKTAILISSIFYTFTSHGILISHYEAEGNALDTIGLNDGINHNVNFSDGQLGMAFDFAGNQSLIQIADDPTLDINSQITLAAWIRPTAFGSNLGTTAIVWKADTNLTTAGQSYAFMYANDVVTFRLGDNVNIYAAGGAVSLNNYTHILGTYDGMELKFFTNGIFTSSTVIGAINIFNSQGDLLLGSSGELGAPFHNFFSGQVDDVRIYDRVLTDLEIFKLAHENIFTNEFE